MTLLLLSLGLGLLPRPRRTEQPQPAGKPAVSPPLIAGVAVAALLGVLAGPAGWVLATPAAIGAHRVVTRIIRHAKAEPDRVATAFLLDLVATSLATGLPVDAAIGAMDRCVSEYGGPRLAGAAEPLRVVGRLLTLGCDPARAWSELDGCDGLGGVAAAGRRCARSGARLAGALTGAAEQLRAEHRQHQLARAQRTGVWALLPLGLCFLPAFICLGIAPVVIGLAGPLLGSGPGGSSALQ